MANQPANSTTLADIIASRTISTIDDVVAVMRGIDAALPNGDGLKWFNLLYLKVTEGVRDRPPAESWKDPAWLERLDVLFADLYFNAIAAWEQNPDKVARCWFPLLASRQRSNIKRLQFALAGMNAHINHDLAIAVVQTAKERDIAPRRGSPQYRDFDRVNAILEVVEGEVKQHIATGIIGEIDQKLGDIDDILAMWKVRKARETAWLNAEIIWRLESAPLATADDDFLLNLDRLVGLASRGFLIAVG
jgi:hypothetical protein